MQPRLIELISCAIAPFCCRGRGPEKKTLELLYRLLLLALQLDRTERLTESAGERQINSIYSLDFEAGIMTNRVSGKRVLVLATEAWVTLASVLRKAFGEGAPAYIRQVGYAIGISLGRNIAGRPLSPSETNMAALKVARAAGWGKVTVSGDTRRWTRYSVRFEHCPSCAEEQAGMPPVCDLMTGVVNGLEDEIFHKPHKVTETTCGYKKDGACEFLVEETAEPTDEQKHWASYVLFPWLRR